MSDPAFSFAVFPFLKTRNPVSIGGYTFRSTDDSTGLNDVQAKSLNEIAEMMYLQDGFRLRSCSYALVPYVDLRTDVRSPVEEQLERIHSVVAYCYSSPDEISGRPFFAFEHASLVLLSPGHVPVPFVRPRPEDHVVDTEQKWSHIPAKSYHVGGYWGRFNFKHLFWVAPGSRIYPPVPHMSLNFAQDLASNVIDFATSRPYGLLIELINNPLTVIAERVLTAIQWFNSANAIDIRDAIAVLNLSVAFETLLALPKDQKTERFTDAVSLLLGRVPRLHAWATQFYDLRSAIVHQGIADNPHFVATDSRRVPGKPPLYGSLLSYGRQIFQLCLGTVLFGAEFAQTAGLQERLVTNQERFERICRIFNEGQLTAQEKLERIREIVPLLDQYRFVLESNLSIDTMISAGQSATAALLECDTTI
jgi:hypothetical protein